MNHSRNTTRTLCLNILATLLCASVFIGSTFAWFNLSVKNQGNKIQMGKLDIAIYNVADDTSEELVQTIEGEVTKDSILFEDISWKPGTVAYENLTIQNAGSLAFEYKISFEMDAFNTIVDNDEDTTNDKSLKDVVKVAILERHIELSADITETEAVKNAILEKVKSDAINMYEPQEDQQETAKWASVENFQYKGGVMNTVAGTEAAATKNIAVVMYWEPSGETSTYNDSAYNSAVNTTSDGKPLYLNLGLQFEALQADVEEDSFGTEYDAGAATEVEVSAKKAEESIDGEEATGE